HRIARPRIVVPAIVGFEVHWRELPDLAPVVDALLESARRLAGAYFQPILEQDDAGMHHQSLEHRHYFQESICLLVGAETHHPLDTRPVVPATVEDNDLSRSRQVRKIALYVHLGLLALGRRSERNDAEHPRAHPLGDRLDGAALAGAVAALEKDAHLQPLELDPLLQFDELDVELSHLPRIVLPRHLVLGRRCAPFLRPCFESSSVALLALALRLGLPCRAFLCHRRLQRIDATSVCQRYT